ncbi:antigen peptide transporter 2 [Paramormyrops kingsleyae]|uniref:antigen peptide transporter 2 n=1 Tax=Paramormyrops kingsleyae TaxID=1676925 RepID=UPI003B971611
MVDSDVGVFTLVLFCDLTLWGALWSGTCLVGVPCSVGLAGLWTFGLLRWCLLYWVSRATVASGRERPWLQRWVATHSLLSPVFESVRNALHRGVPVTLLPGPAAVALLTVSSAGACLFWELSFPEDRADRRAAKKKHEAKALLMRVVRYSRADAPHLAVAFLFLILAVAGETFVPYATGNVIDILSSQYEYSSFLWAIGVFGLFSMGSSFCAGVRGGMFKWSLARLNKRVCHMLFGSLMKQEIGFFEETEPGHLCSRLESDTNKMSLSVVLNMNALVRSVVKTVGMLALMLGISWQLTLLTCVEMPVLALLQNAYSTYSLTYSQQVQDCKARTTAAVAAALDGVRTVRSCSGEATEVRRYEETLREMRRIQNRKGGVSAVHLLLRRLVTIFVKVLMLIYGRRLILLKQLTGGRLLSFVIYQKNMLSNMKELVAVCGAMLTSVGAAAKVFKYLDRKPRQEEAGHLEPVSLEGRVDFRNVTFSYPSQPDKPVLRGLTLTLQPGKMTALVGPSGAGKSSCICLLERFYEPQEGEVLLDGRPLHHYSHRYLHQQVVLVSQDPQLFSSSVRCNIAYGLEECSLDKVKEAAIKASAHDFISRLEHGYDSDMGKGAAQLAAGERQRLAIARALVREPRVIILDEATRHMDASTQQAVQDVLSGSVGQTVLVVAHHLQTVQKADHIVYLEDGVVVEQGTHAQLMALRRRYYRQRERLFDLPVGAGN